MLWNDLTEDQRKYVLEELATVRGSSSRYYAEAIDAAVRTLNQSVKTENPRK